MFSYAILKNDIEQVNMLLKQHDPALDNQDAIKTAIEVSLHENNLPILDVLLSHPGVDPSIHHHMLFKRACIMNKPWTCKVVQRLAKHPRINPYVDSHYGLRVSCRNGNAELVTWFLDLPETDASAIFNIPIRIACNKGHIHIVRMLLQRPEVNPNDIESHAMRISSQQLDSSIVRELMKDHRIDLSILPHCKALVDKNHSLLLLLSCHDDVEKWNKYPSSLHKWNEALRLVEYSDVLKEKTQMLYLYMATRIEPSPLLHILPSSILIIICTFL
jgi:ankyrin repeat protein